jgi:hypothetical protein
MEKSKFTLKFNHLVKFNWEIKNPVLVLQN